MLVAGTYEFDDDMCSNQGGSALCIDRRVTIEAEVAGSVVLDAKGSRRVIYVSTAGRAELVGLNITGGATGTLSYSQGIQLLKGGTVCSPFELFLNFHPAPRWKLTCTHAGRRAGDSLFWARQR